MLMLETRLKTLSEENKSFSELYDKFKVVRASLEKELQIVPVYFPHFSRHDASHSESIAMYISMLLGEKRISRLSFSDMLLFLLACYSHDLGMSLTYQYIHDEMTSEPFSKLLVNYTTSQQEDIARAAAYLIHVGECAGDGNGCMELVLKIYEAVQLLIEERFRADHAKRSYKSILEKNEIQGLLSDRMTRILGEICYCHGKELDELWKLPYECNGFLGDYIHPRFLGAMLCLGDLLDLDTDRFDETVLRAVTKMPTLSELHRKKHESITKYLVKDGIIRIQADCENTEVYRVMRQWIDMLEETCRFLDCNWIDLAPEGFEYPPYLKEKEILLNHNAKWTAFADLKFHISNEHALELIQGAGIYRDKCVFMREIIQNAVDATLIQIFQDLRKIDGSWPDEACLMHCLTRQGFLNKYQIEGKIYLENGKPTVILRDNGTGISTDNIRRIASVSSSDKKEMDIVEKMPVWFKPSGAFSIGLQSIFLVADSFEVITKTSDEPAKRVVFEETKGGHGYIVISDSDERFTNGTTIKITINADKFSQDDLGVVDYYYHTEDKNTLILNKLLRDCYNMEDMEQSPWLNLRRRKTDYIPVHIVCESEKQTKDVLKYTSIFNNSILWDGNPNIHVKDGLITYSSFDRDNNCIFNGLVELKTTENHVYGRMPSPHSLRFRHSLFYRNSFVKDNVVSPIGDAQDAKWANAIDWSINLLSDNADRILNLGRNDIRNSFAEDLEKLIHHEIDLMARSVIDYALERSIESDAVFLIDCMAADIGYRCEEIETKYAEILNKIQIQHYYPLSGKKEQNYTFAELKNMTLHFLQPLSEPFQSIQETIPESVCVQKSKGDVYLWGRLPKEKNFVNHIIDHRLLYENILIFNKQKYHELVAEPLRTVRDTMPKRADIFYYDEFLNILFGNLRCMHTEPKYHLLLTNINSDWHYHKPQLRVEMSLDPTLKSQLTEDIKNGFLKDAVQKFERKIADTEVYQNNLEFIRLVNNDTPADTIEKSYREWWRYLLSLLEREDLAAYCMATSARITAKMQKDQIWNSPLLIFDDDNSRDYYITT